MKNLILLCIIGFMIFSCFGKSGNVIDLNNLDDKIHIGMSKIEVVDSIGVPKDSVFSENNKNFYYRYDTNDFTGYTLKIWFDRDNKVEYYRVD